MATSNSHAVALDGLGGVPLEAFQGLPVGDVHFEHQKEFAAAVPMKVLIGVGLQEPEWAVWAYLYPAVGAAKYAALSLYVDVGGSHEAFSLDEVKTITSLKPVFEPLKAAPPRLSAFLKFCFVKKGVDCITFTNNLRYDLMQACRLFEKAQKRTETQVDASVTARVHGGMLPPARRVVTTPPQQTPGGKRKRVPGLRAIQFPNPNYSNASSVTITGTPQRPNFAALATSKGRSNASGGTASLVTETTASKHAEDKTARATETTTASATTTANTTKTMTDMSHDTTPENGTSTATTTGIEPAVDGSLDSMARTYAALRRQVLGRAQRIVSLESDVGRMLEEARVLKGDNHVAETEMKRLRNLVTSVEDAFQFGVAVERATRAE